MGLAVRGGWHVGCRLAGRQPGDSGDAGGDHREAEREATAAARVTLPGAAELAGVHAAIVRGSGSGSVEAGHRRDGVPLRAMARPSLVLVVLAVLAGCGSEEPSATRTERAPAASAPPSAGRPELPTPSGPPPAWLETERGSFWLGYSTFCWDRTCADYIAPSCDDERHVPTIVVRKGEQLTAHLGFEPREVTLRSFPAHGRQRLEASRDPSWRAEREGAFVLFTGPEDRSGDASYVACLRFE
jgi:hypothetical protein